MASPVSAITIPRPSSLDESATAAALDLLDQPVAILAGGSAGDAAVIAYANEALGRLTGRQTAQLVGLPFADLLAPDLADGVATALTATVRDQVAVQINTRLYDGGVDDPPVRLSLKPLPASATAQAALPLTLCCIDMAHHRNALPDATVPDDTGTLNALQEIVDTISEGFVMFDRNDRLLMYNRQIRELYPLRAHIYRRGTHLADILRAGIACGELSTNGLDPDEFVAQRTSSDRIVDGVRENFMADGRTILISQRRTADGRIVAIHTDITELRRAHELLRNAIEAMDEGFAVYGPDDRLLVCNQKLRELHPEMADILQPGTHFADILRNQMETGAWTATPDDIDAYIEKRVRQRRSRSESVIERSRADGTWMRISGKLLPDGHYVAIHTDITEQKTREIALTDAKTRAESASRAKSSFLANVSHELRTPLNAILGFSEVMRAEMFSPLGSHRYLEYVTDVNASAQHLLELINDLLDMSKIEAGELTLHDEYFALPPLIDECVRHLKPQFTQAGIELHQTIAPALPELRADMRAIRQVLLNLLSNAIKFTPAGGSVAVNVRTDGGAFIFTVSDTGVGIRAEDLERLAKPFQQVGDPMLSNSSGTGLGLSISRSLIELHGGTIGIASTFGEGTSVTIRLPPSRNAGEFY